jgi:hypothetical protein
MSCKKFLATFVFTLILAIRWVEPYDLSLAISFWFAGRVVVGVRFCIVGQMCQKLIDSMIVAKFVCLWNVVSV